MPVWKLTLAYEGTDFCGWQRQPGQRTVQGSLEAAWPEVTGEEPNVTAASRTDSGVHALGQVVALTTEKTLTATEVQGALNAKLPEDVAVVAVEEAPKGFPRDARLRRETLPLQHLQRPRAPRWPSGGSFGTSPIRSTRPRCTARARRWWARTTSLASRAVGSERESTVRTIHGVEVTRAGQGVVIEVEGDGFLYNMVRIIAGTLVEVGRGKRPEAWVAEALTACDRAATGPTAPPQGLCLLRVDY